MSREGTNGTNKREWKSLQRSKSEKGKESPRHEKQKLKERFGGVFRRSFKRKSSQVFEDCNEEFATFSVHTPDSPPTPRDRRKKLSLRLPKTDGNQDHSSTNTSSTESDTSLTPQSISRRSMFNEASELARASGVVDLWRADPAAVRQETGPPALREGKEEEEKEFSSRRQVGVPVVTCTCILYK